MAARFGRTYLRLIQEQQAGWERGSEAADIDLRKAVRRYHEMTLGFTPKATLKCEQATTYNIEV